MEKFPFSPWQAAACKRLYLPLAFVSWVFFLPLGFPFLAPVVVAAFFMMFAHSLLVPPQILSYKAKISAIWGRQRKS